MARKQTLLDLWSPTAKRTKPPPEEHIMYLEASESMPAQCPSASTSLGPAEERYSSRDAVCRIETKFHPGTSFKFPKNDSRSCQSSWFLTYQWLHYDEKQDCVFCFDCARAFEMKGLKSLHGVEPAFLKTGFRNWRKGPHKFKMHERSEHHRDSIHHIIQREKGASIAALISKQSLQQQQENRAAVRVIVSSLRFLARSGFRVGLGLSGRPEPAQISNGDLVQLLEERREDVPALRTWLNKRDRWLSGDVQNEILKIMAHSVQRMLVDKITQSPFYAIMADSTTDTSGQEQFSVCVRYVSPDTLDVHEAFLGMYNPPDTKAATLFSTIKDVLIRLSLSFHNLRGHCFDGAASMSGKISGVQKLIKDEQPKSTYVHCCNHSLDLALQEAGRSSEVICTTLTIVKDVSNAILNSAKRKSIYAGIVSAPCPSECEMDMPVKQLLPLCPTRWSVRVNSMSRFLDNYGGVQITLAEILKEKTSIRDDRRAAFQGYLKRLQRFETMFYLMASIKVFGPCEELARALQSSSCSATVARKSADVLELTLRNLRSDDAFDEIFLLASAKADKLNLKFPSETRKKRPPKRLESTSRPVSPASLDLKDALRKDFFELVDTLTAEIHRRFTQPGLDELVRL
ncbi:unnamed protein product [Ixodes hexagonus]